MLAKRLDEIVADFIKTGPTADEVQRYVTNTVSGTIGGLESVGGFGGKAVALAQGALYSNDPGYYKKQLAALAAQTPATVQAAAAKWLTRPVYALTVEPGARDAYAEALVPKEVQVVQAANAQAKGTRGPIPAAGVVASLAFPEVSRARLSNGIELVYAQRTAVPVTLMTISFDAGVAADPADKLGTQQLTLEVMQQGTTTRDSIALAEAQERLGTRISAYTAIDRTGLGIYAPSANLGGALDLLADVAQRPAFAPEEVARVRNQQLAGIAQELTNPNALAGRVVPKLTFGPAHPYAKAFGSGDPKAVGALTRDDLIAFQRAWLRPEKAKIFVTSDRPLA